MQASVNIVRGYWLSTNNKYIAFLILSESTLLCFITSCLLTNLNLVMWPEGEVLGTTKGNVSNVSKNDEFVAILATKVMDVAVSIINQHCPKIDVMRTAYLALCDGKPNQSTILYSITYVWLALWTYDDALGSTSPYKERYVNIWQLSDAELEQTLCTHLVHDDPNVEAAKAALLKFQKFIKYAESAKRQASLKSKLYKSIEFIPEIRLNQSGRFHTTFILTKKRKLDEVKPSN